MADISQIKLPSGTTYDIKDAAARAAIEALGHPLTYVLSTGASTTPDVTKYQGQTQGTLAPSAATEYKIYLVPNGKSTGSNVHEEWLTINKGTVASPVYAWELIGSTDIDLSGYAKKGDGVTVTLNNAVSGTAVSAHSVTDTGHAHTASGTVTPTGTNAASAVSFSGTTGAASVKATDGSVTSGEAASLKTGFYTAGTAPTMPTFAQGTDSFTAATYGTDNFTAAAIQEGFYTAGSAGTAAELTTTVANDVLTIGWTANTPTTPATVDTTKFSGGSYSHTGFVGGSFTQGSDTWTAGDAGTMAAIDTSKFDGGTPTAVTLPTFTAVENLVTTSTTAQAAAQVFTGEADTVTVTVDSAVTGISIADHTVTQGTVTGTAAGTIDA